MVQSGNAPLSSAYETGTHLSTSLNRNLVADDGIEPPTGAYETPEIPFLQPASEIGSASGNRTLLTID